MQENREPTAPALWGRFVRHETGSLQRRSFLIEYSPESLRMVRLHRELKQAELARLAQVSRDYISELERGRSRPTIEVLGRLGQALDVFFFF